MWLGPHPGFSISRRMKMNTRLLKKHLKYKIPQIKLALLREPTHTPLPAITTPDDLHQYLEPMRYLSEEHFVALHLDAKHQITGYHVVSHGTVSASLVHPREVFKAALLNNAYTMVIAHNHPAGSTEPSEDDLATTRQLVGAGNLLAVKILDHLIVTYKQTISLRELYPHLF
jgi:DNA repair protein RadC